MSGKEKQYYEIKKSHLWIGVGIMLSIIVITYFRQDLFDIWQRKQGRENVTYEGIKSVLEDNTECYLCGNSDRSLMGYYRKFDTLGLILLNDMASINVSLPEDYRPDIKIWKYEKKQAILLCLVDFRTLEIYFLQDWHVGGSIRAYWVDMEYDEEKVEVNAYYLPTRE